jgi:hypothetical protein
MSTLPSSGRLAGPWIAVLADDEVYATLPDQPGTCAHCGQECGCGGVA